MAQKTVKLGDFSRELAEFSRASLKTQRKAVANALARAIPRLSAAGPIESTPTDTGYHVDRGTYANSWDFSVDEQVAIIGNFAPYASIIENGARPFTPPLAPLLAWAKRVLQDSSQPPSYSPEVQALARGVQRKISIHGMKPHHILEQEIPRIIEDIKEELARGAGTAE